ncbi:hypothetical protein MCEMRE196_00546 [Candidatus Nanopelagicaceae bacterium]
MPGLSQHPYLGRDVVLTSKHQKLDLFRPHFQSQLEMNVRELPLDTDLLGTFSGEIERVDSPREAAIKKARMGIQATGIPLGIASEGSIGADPVIPWIQCDYELAVFLDEESGLVISESITSHDIAAATISGRIGDDLSEFLLRADFPRHHLIVRPESNMGSLIVKGISDLASLASAVERCSLESKTGLVRIESDFRALHSPSRQSNISQVADRLAKRVASLCPECNVPGWGRVDYIKGVECSECGEISPERIRQEILGCSGCDFKELGEVLKTFIDAAQCLSCNP